MLHLTRTGKLWLAICVALVLSQTTCAQAHSVGNAVPKPGLPQPSPIDPTLLYNSILSSGQTTVTAEPVAAADWSISPAVTNLANGARLSYPNAPRPASCLTFDDLDYWASHVYADGRMQGSAWNDHYAGWNAFAVDDGGFYRAENATTSYDPNVGNRISAKVSSSQPFAAGFRSPWFTAQKDSTLTVRVRYLLEKPPDGAKSFDWAALGIKAGPQSPARYVNGYVHGRWAELENLIDIQAGQFMVLLQAHNPAVVASAAYFDDVEILIDGIPLLECAY
jgi:hypothetical protein